jgi:hypothetical protein
MKLGNPKPVDVSDQNKLSRLLHGLSPCFLTIPDYFATIFEVCTFLLVFFFLSYFCSLFLNSCFFLLFQNVLFNQENQSVNNRYRVNCTTVIRSREPGSWRRFEGYE